MSAEVEILSPNSDVEFVEDPQSRAQERFNRLSASFALTLVTVAEMHRDEDWRYLTREDGTAYRNLAEVVQDAAAVSAAMARRYIQGVKTLLLPISSLTVEGTAVPITAADVAQLGEAGASEVIEVLNERLSGHEGPEEATEIIRDTIAETRQRRAQEKAPGVGADGWDDPAAASFDADDEEDWGTDTDPVRPGTPRASTSGFSDDPDDVEPMFEGSVSSSGRHDEQPEDDSADEDDFEAAPAAPAPQSSGTDVIERILTGAPTFKTPEDRQALPQELRAYVSALTTVGEMDPFSVAQLLDTDTRGVLTQVNEAITGLTRLRANAMAQPWFIKSLS